MQEVTNQFIWELTDPEYGLYKNSQKKIGSLSPEDTRATIEKLYLNYPKSVTLVLNRYALNVPSIGMSIQSLLSTLSIGNKTQPADPLSLLKTRFVKGEITKEQYEEMKKTIDT